MIILSPKKYNKPHFIGFTTRIKDTTKLPDYSKFINQVKEYFKFDDTITTGTFIIPI